MLKVTVLVPQLRNYNCSTNEVERQFLQILKMDGLRCDQYCENSIMIILLDMTFS